MRTPRRRRVHRTRRGGTMLLTMSVLAGVVAVLTSFVATQSAEFRARLNRVEGHRARLMAESGLERALAELSVPAANPAAATLQDAWAVLGESGARRFVLRGDSFRIEVLDACAFVNLSFAPEEQLLRLPLTNEQIDSLIDWRSNAGQGRPEGAKDEYYNTLENPYNAALRPLETLDELLLIKGFSGPAVLEIQTDVVSTQFLAAGRQEDQPVLAELATVRSEAPDVAPDGSAKLNVNTATVAQLVQRGLPGPLATAIVQRRNTQGTYDRLGQVFAVPGISPANAATILDQLRVGNEEVVRGRINLNTAGETVLNTIPGLTSDIAAAIVSRQGAGFAALGEFAQLPGVTSAVLQQAADWVTVNTRTFLVRVIGTAGRMSVPLEALVSVEDGLPRVLQVSRPLSSDPIWLWRWPSETTVDVSVKEGM